MVAEEHGESTTDRVYELLDAIHERYKAGTSRVGAYTPYVVRIAEVILAIALFVGLARWIYLFSVA